MRMSHRHISLQEYSLFLVRAGSQFVGVLTLMSAMLCVNLGSPGPEIAEKPGVFCVLLVLCTLRVVVVSLMIGVVQQ